MAARQPEESVARAAVNEERLFTRDFIFVCLSNFFFFSSMHILLSTLPVYIIFLGIPEAQLGIVLGIFTFTAVIARLIVGREADRRGRRSFLLAGPVVFFAASSLYNWARSFVSLIGVRLFHGVGIAAFTVAASALIADLAPAHRRGEALGYFSTLASLSMLIAPALGMVIYYSLGFTIMFLFSASLAIVAFGLALPVGEAPTPARPPSSQEGPAVFFSRGAAYPAFLMACLTITFGCVTSFVPLYALEKGMTNPGFFFTVYAVVVSLARLVAGGISDRWGRATVIIPAMVLTSAGTALLATASSTLTFLLLAAFYGVGFGSAYPPLIAMAVDRVPPTERGAAMGTFTAAFDMGIGLGTILWGFVLQYSGFEMLYLTASLVPIIGLATFPVARWRRR